MSLTLIGVTMLVVTGNQISDSEAEVATLKREDAIARGEGAAARRLHPVPHLREQRIATVRSLADSRFDWERVMRELSLVLPSDVWLTSLNASASAGSSAGGESGGGASSLRGAIAGPALELSGCATGQEAVAGFVTALKDIDGVTRVGVTNSELASKKGEAGSGKGGGGDCRTRSFIAQFSLVVAFDAAPLPPEEGEEAAVSTAAAAESSANETEGSEKEGEEG